MLGALVLAGCGGASPVPSGGGAEPTSCCTHGPTEAPGGLSPDEAIAAARRYAAGGNDAAVIWAATESDPFARPNGAVVWEVRLATGLAGPSCPSEVLGRLPSPSDAFCLDQDGGVIVVLDFFSGAFRGWLH